jgi:hypothetical protein
MPRYRLYDNRDPTDRLIIYGKVSKQSGPLVEAVDTQMDFPLVEKVHVVYAPENQDAFEREFDVKMLTGPYEAIANRVFIMPTKRGTFKDIIICTKAGIVNLHMYARTDSYGIQITTEDSGNGGHMCSNSINSPLRKSNTSEPVKILARQY